MKTVIKIAMISMLMIFAAPAFAGSAVSVYTCQQDDSASEEDVIGVAEKWLALAKKVKGGENLEVRVMFPVAATLGDNDFMFVVIAPSFSEWGTFMDNYGDSDVSDEDKEFAHIANCSDSALWESF